MKILLTLILIMFSFFSKGSAQYDQLATDFSFDRVDGKTINLLDHKGKVIIVVNVASRCGFTNQYEDYNRYGVRTKTKVFLWLAFRQIILDKNRDQIKKF